MRTDPPRATTSRASNRNAGSPPADSEPTAAAPTSVMPQVSKVSSTSRSAISTRRSVSDPPPPAFRLAAGRARVRVDAGRPAGQRHRPKRVHGPEPVRVQVKPPASLRDAHPGDVDDAAPVDRELRLDPGCRGHDLAVGALDLQAVHRDGKRAPEHQVDDGRPPGARARNFDGAAHGRGRAGHHPARHGAPHNQRQRQHRQQERPGDARRDPQEHGGGPMLPAAGGPIHVRPSVSASRRRPPSPRRFSGIGHLRITRPTLTDIHFRQARAWPYFRHRHGTGSSGPSRGRAPARARHARVARARLRGDYRGVRASGAATSAGDPRSEHQRHARRLAAPDQEEDPQQQDRLVAVRAQGILRPGHLGGGSQADRPPLRLARLLSGPGRARRGHAGRQGRRGAESDGRGR